MITYLLTAISIACAAAAWLGVRRYGLGRYRKKTSDDTLRRLYGQYWIEVKALTQTHMLKAPTDEEWLAEIRTRASAAAAGEAAEEAARYSSSAVPQLEDRPGLTAGVATTGQESHTDSLPRISVVIPALNEARNLPHVFAQLPWGIHEVILVDGNSVDDTVAVARSLNPGVRVVTQTRKGKGNALACGFAAATGDIIVTLDADGSADPGEIPQFVSALLAGADFAKGTRFAGGGGSADITRLQGFSSRILSALVNLLYRSRFSDLCYGYNAFWRIIVPALDLDIAPGPPDANNRRWGDGFEIEMLMAIRSTKAGLRITEVPSFEHSRIHGVSNLNVISDGLRVLRIIFYEYKRPPGTVRVATSPGSSSVNSYGTQPVEATELSARRAQPR